MISSSLVLSYVWLFMKATMEAASSNDGCNHDNFLNICHEVIETRCHAKRDHNMG